MKHPLPPEPPPEVDCTYEVRVTCETLSATLGSLTELTTSARNVTVPPKVMSDAFGTVPATVAVALWPAFSVPRLHETYAPPEHEPLPALAEVKLKTCGRNCVNITFAAAAGP